MPVAIPPRCRPTRTQATSRAAPDPQTAKKNEPTTATALCHHVFHPVATGSADDFPEGGVVLYPIAPMYSGIGSSAESRQCAVMPVRPMNTEQPRQPKTSGDSPIDRLLPQRR